MPSSTKFLDGSGLTLYDQNIKDYIDNIIENDIAPEIDSKASMSTVTVTIASGDWSNNSCTKNATGVTASNTVIVSAAPASISIAANAGFYCSGQGSGTLTFSCTTTPSSTITVNVVILN